MAKRTFKKQELKISIDDSYRTMPNAMEVEKSLLGTMITDPQCINRVIELIPDERIFYSEANQKIFSVIKEFTFEHSVDDLGLPILIEKLRERNQLDEVGGISYLSELITMVESAERVEVLCKILIEKYMAREIIKHCFDIATKGYDGTLDVFKLLNDAEAGLFAISEMKYKRTFESLKTLVEKTMNIIDRVRKSEVPGISTGYPKFDIMTGGFQNSDLIIVAARPGIGKTAFGISLALNIAERLKIPVGFFSLEMKAEQIVMRLISQKSKIDVSKIRTGKYSKTEESELVKAIRSLVMYPIYIDDTPSISLHELRAKARRMIKEHNVKIVFVDYLQLMQGPSDVESREREISFISRGLKAMAKELDIPIIALAQLNRQVEIRQTKRPMLSDLRESGSIEQDADMVCFLHRPDLYSKKSDDEGELNDSFKPKIVELIIAKQRNGPTGSFNLVFFPEFTRFEEATTIEFIEKSTREYVVDESESKNFDDLSPTDISKAPF